MPYSKQQERHIVGSTQALKHSISTNIQTLLRSRELLLSESHCLESAVFKINTNSQYDSPKTCISS